MKNLFVLSVLCLSFSAHAQNLSGFGGFNQNRFWHRAEGGPNQASYSKGNGFQFGIGIDSIRLDWMTCSFTVGLTQYSGGFDVRTGSHGYSDAMEGNITKTVLDMSMFPIHFSATKWVVFRFGLVWRIYLDERLEGTESGWAINSPSYQVKLEDSEKTYSNGYSFGVSGKVMLNLGFNHLYRFGPYYSAYHSLVGKEFGNNELHPTNVLQHSIGLSISRKINLYKK